MEIRQTNRCDLDEILKIYDSARQYMLEHGNPTQWIEGYPDEKIILLDIENGNHIVCFDGNRIQGCFTFRNSPFHKKGEKMKMRYILLIAVSMFICNSGDAFAGNVDIPYTFSSSGTPAMASDVYDNFKAVETAVDDNDRRIADLETDIVNIRSSVSSSQTMGDTDQETTRKLQQTVVSLQKTVKNQQAVITSLESKINSFQSKDKAQQEKIADFIKRLEALEKKRGNGATSEQ